ncbi:thiol reductant ABC exporter subunit CydD [Gorillibacterium sp. sgz5001074]|uniref:thiol reductant ABC exporter subunit CydD n=1 Tax=Gorillibacterium sp. sgz5001074 TaxID=3446695 RepID=UPI003F6724A0
MMKKLLQTVPAARMLLVASVGLGLAGGVLILLEAFYVARITDRVFLGGEELGRLMPALLILASWIVLRVLVQIAGDALSMKLAARVKQELRIRLVRKLAELGPQAVKRERSGELLAVLYEGVEQLETYLAKYLPQAALSALVPAAVLCATVRLDLTSTLILGFTMPLLIFFMILIGVTTKAKTERQFKALGLLGGHFHDVVRGLATLQIFGRSKAQLDIIRRIGEEHRKTTMGTLRLAFLSGFVMELFATLCTAIVAVFLGLRLVDGGIDFYRAYAVLLLTPEFYLPVRALGTQYHTGMNGRIAAERILGILEQEPPGWVEREGAVKPEASELREGIRIDLDRVRYRYPEAEDDALAELTLALEPGQRVAVIGHTGAGKSTVLELLQGFLRPAEGEIRVNGVSMSELSMDWWRSQLSVVAQETRLFQGTLLDNLRLGRPEATLEEAMEAARLAQADGFIRQLPEGYQTRIGEQVRLSGGQMQRIAIARALLRNAPVLLLDEPTSGLDLENEAMVQAALAELTRGRTVVTAAHRLDTIRDADWLIVLEQGRVAEAGRPAELAASGGRYAAMLRAAGTAHGGAKSRTAAEAESVPVERASSHPHKEVAAG